MTYAGFFQNTRRKEQVPYAYQCRLAGGEAARLLPPRSKERDPA